MDKQEKRRNLLNSLRQITPMPADEALTEELLIRREEIICALRPIADEECIEH